MTKMQAQRKFMRRHSKADRRPRKIFQRDPMKKLLKRMTNVKIRQQVPGEERFGNNRCYRRIVDLPWIFYD